MEELELFVVQLDTLPCKVEGHDVVTSLLEQVESFQKDASKLLDMDKPSLDDMQKCVDLGETLDVDLAQLSKLKEHMKQTEWFEEVNEVAEDPKSSTYEQLEELLESGKKLDPHPKVERALGMITGLMREVFTDGARFRGKHLRFFFDVIYFDDIVPLIAIPSPCLLRFYICHRESGDLHPGLAKITSCSVFDSPNIFIFWLLIYFFRSLEYSKTMPFLFLR